MASTDSHDTKGVSLARGPALILGSVLLVAGLYFLYKVHTFPPLSQFPSGQAHVDGKAFFGIFGLNGWSGELTAVAGGLLLFGAAQHFVAKTMSLIVGVVLAVVAIIALLNHHSALGLFAANIWTIILWAGSAALLLINTFVPRVGGHSATTDDNRAPAGTATTPPVERPSTMPRQPVRTTQADISTIIPERGAIRVRPSDESSRSDQEEGIS